ncbi:putative ribonuclease H-like domain-containing protein [Tanacetum coccineum]
MKNSLSSRREISKKRLHQQENNLVLLLLRFANNWIDKKDSGKEFKSILLLAILMNRLLKVIMFPDAKSSLGGKQIKGFRGNDESKRCKDINQKFLRSLPPSWSQIGLIMRNKTDIDQTDIDDLYNNLRVYEDEMKRSSSSTSNSQNLAFLSSKKSNTMKSVLPWEILELILLEELAQQISTSGSRWSRRAMTGSNDFDELVNYALMAISSSSSSSSSDNEGYELALESLESRILGHEKNELAWGEKYEFHKDYVRSSNEEITPANDSFSKADGYHAVPPPITENFLTPRADISFAETSETVDELKFNLFSVSQMCDKKNSVLFTDTECLILSPSFKLLYENQVVLRAPRQNDKPLKKKRRGQLRLPVLTKTNTGRPSVSTSNSPLVNTTNTPYASAASTPTGANTVGAYASMIDVGVEADFNNMDNTIDVSPIPILRVHKDYPKGQILGDPKSAVQIRGRIQKASSVQQALVSYIYNQNRTNHKDRISGGERSIVVKNKARLVAQGFRQEEGIDYDQVFVPVARIDAIRLFLAFVSFMGFPVYQMDVKSAFLYGTRSMIGSMMYCLASGQTSVFAVCACASDHGGTSLDKKSTTDGCQFLGRRLISWQCKKQTIMANSTTKAEYVAAANCCGKVLTWNLIKGRKKSKPESTLDDSTVFNDQDADHGIKSWLRTRLMSGLIKGGNAEELVSTARPEVSTARPDIDAARQEDSVIEPRTPPTTTSIFDDEDIIMAQTLIKMREEKAKEKRNPKDNGKGVLKESPVKKVKRSDLDAAQIATDAEIARLVHEKELAEIEREREERQRQDQASVDYIANLYNEEESTLLKEQERVATVKKQTFPNKNTTGRRVLMMNLFLTTDAYFIPIGSKRDEKMIDKMNKKAASMDEENIPEETESTKVEVKQEQHEENIRKRSGRRLKMKATKKSKRQKTDSNLKEEEQLRASLKIVHDEEEEIDYEFLGMRYPIVNWESAFYHTDRYVVPHDYY